MSVLTARSLICVSLGEESVTTLEIVVRPESAEEVRREFDEFLQCAKANGWKELKVLFGLGGETTSMTGIDRGHYDSERLAQRVAKAESLKDGKIGSDDLYVTPLALGIEHTFCHHVDIH